MKLTKHADVRGWVDFVRGTSETEERSAMEAHLATGCRRCQATVRMLHGVVDVARADLEYDVPPNVVRRARAIFPVHRPETSVLARLIYDSFREPLAAGLRGETRVARHATFEAGNVFVDLQLEHEPSSGVVTLVGQVSDYENPAINTTSLPILLMAKRGLVTSAMCNRLGEFEMEFAAARNLWLHVPLRETDAHIDLRMDELAPVPLRRARRPALARRRSTGARRRTRH